MCLSINPKDESRLMEFVETICVEQGRAWNLKLHNERMNRTRRVFWGNDIPECRLEDWIHPESYIDCTRCRVVYGKTILSVNYIPYHMRSVNSVKLIVSNHVDYQFKWANRSILNELYEQRGVADDVLIVRHGLLTDTTIANIALFDGINWFTPSNPLLRGTRRQFLLDNGWISVRDIRIEDINQYQKIRLFNAMIPFGRIELDTSSIITDELFSSACLENGRFNE